MNDKEIYEEIRNKLNDIYTNQEYILKEIASLKVIIHNSINPLSRKFALWKG